MMLVITMLSFVVYIVVDQKSADNKDDDVYDELLTLKLDDAWLTQSTSVQPGFCCHYGHLGVTFISKHYPYQTTLSDVIKQLQWINHTTCC